MTLSADDKLAIHELLSLYCVHIDTLDRESWMELFSPEGRWLAPWYDLQTREDFEEHAAKRLEDPTAGRVQYWVSNVIITEIGDRGEEASVRSDVVRFEGAEDKTSGHIAFMGTYNDIVHRVDGRWKFKLRSITEDDILVDQARSSS